MIDIKELTKKDKMKDVIFDDGGLRQRGLIHSWNDRFILVDYGFSIGKGIPTDPENLDWA